MKDAEHIDGELQFVVFELANEFYGVNILEVKEIKKITEFTRIPQAPDYYQGVINLRGSVFPIINLHKRLNLPIRAYTEDTRVIMVKFDDTFVGIIVDAVLEVTVASPKDIETSQAISAEGNSQYTSGVFKSKNKLISLLNIENIVGVLS